MYKTKSNTVYSGCEHKPWEHDYCAECRIAELESKLKIDEPHPFPDGFDALDLAVQQNKAYIARIEELEAENKRLREAYHELYAEANSWLTSDQPDRIQLLDAMHSKALEEGK